MKITKTWAAFELEAKERPHRCASCGQGPNNRALRWCGKCGREMQRGDKWVIDGCILRHRNCETPDCYCPSVEAHKKSKHWMASR